MRVVHEFQHAVVFREGQGLVCGELKVEIHLLQQEVHELDDLKDDLVLSDIISVLVDKTVDLRVASYGFPGQFIIPAADSEEIQLDWTHGRREYRATLSINA